MKNLIETFKTKELPSIQTKLINQFDGTIESIISFNSINLVLNPVFSYHYFYVSGDSDKNLVTTKQTDGSCKAWGSQTPVMESNAFLFAKALKQELMKLDVCNSIGNPLTSRLNEKIHVRINGSVLKVNGLTTKSSFQ